MKWVLGNGVRVASFRPLPPFFRFVYMLRLPGRSVALSPLPAADSGTLDAASALSFAPRPLPSFASVTKAEKIVQWEAEELSPSVTGVPAFVACAAARPPACAARQRRQRRQRERGSERARSAGRTRTEEGGWLRAGRQQPGEMPFSSFVAVAGRTNGRTVGGKNDPTGLHGCRSCLPPRSTEAVGRAGGGIVIGFQHLCSVQTPRGREERRGEERRDGNG